MESWTVRDEDEQGHHKRHSKVETYSKGSSYKPTATADTFFCPDLSVRESERTAVFVLTDLCTARAEESSVCSSEPVTEAGRPETPLATWRSNHNLVQPPRPMRSGRMQERTPPSRMQNEPASIELSTQNPRVWSDLGFFSVEKFF